MQNVIQADTLRGPLEIRNWDQELCLYYDETNNIRRLKLSELGLNAPADRTFAIAGIALRPGQSLLGWDYLRRAMRIQPSAREVKFEHVADADYEQALNSEKLNVFLSWLVASDLLIHYSVLDVLYWSVLDIVESLMPDGRFNLTVIHAELKNELCFAVRADPTAFMALLHAFNYPNLSRSDVGAFLSCVFSFVSSRQPANRNDNMKVLKHVLRKAAKLRDLELDFLHDNSPGELIGDFSANFLHCLCVFKRGSHVFDEETFVERHLRRFPICDGDRALDYRFADSKDEIGIQASDIVAGLVGRHFTYLQQKPMSELRRRKGTFSELQRANLRLLKTLIDRSDAFSSALLHTIQPLDTSYKNDDFLHGIQAPAYLS